MTELLSRYIAKYTKYGDDNSRYLEMFNIEPTFFPTTEENIQLPLNRQCNVGELISSDYYLPRYNIEQFGFKNIKITGDWVYADLAFGGEYIERIYSQTRNIFPITINGVPPIAYYEIRINVFHNNNTFHTVTYDKAQCDILYLQFRILNNVIFDTNGIVSNITNKTGALAIPRFHVKPSIKCKRIFIETSIARDNCNVILPLYYDGNIDKWVLPNLDKCLFFPMFIDYIKLICIPKDDSKTELRTVVDFDYYNIGKTIDGQFETHFSFY